MESSAAAPAPDATSVILSWSDGTDCRTDVRCWGWPTRLTSASYVLNGTYQVVPCGTYDGTSCGQTFQTQNVQLAVRPGAPVSLSATSSAREVTVHWSPPTAQPPDLAGYSLSRNDRAVYNCSVNGLGPYASVPCPSALTVADHPGDGTYTYSVSTLRLGVDSASSSLLASAATSASNGPVTVPGAAPGSGGTGPTGGTGGTGGGPGFTSTPVIGGTGTPGSGGSAVTPVPGAGAVVGTGADPVAAPAPAQNLHYPSSDNPVVGRSSALALKVAPVRTDVAPVAVLALGLLILAIAAHFLYLRVEMGVVQARMGTQRPPT